MFRLSEKYGNYFDIELYFMKRVCVSIMADVHVKFSSIP